MRAAVDEEGREAVAESRGSVVDGKLGKHEMQIAAPYCLEGEARSGPPPPPPPDSLFDPESGGGGGGGGGCSVDAGGYGGGHRGYKFGLKL